MAEWSRAIAWARISAGNREGAGLEHLLLREGTAADSVVLPFDEPVDEDAVVLDYEGLFRRVA